MAIEHSADAADASAPTRSTPRTSIVLPVYDEADCIREVVSELLDLVEGSFPDSFGEYEVVLVDDGSTDGTLPILRELAASSPAVTVVELRRNFGQSCALAAGMDVAEGEFVVTMDADGQNDPEDIPRLLERLEDGYDCVSGWRRERRDPLSKRVPSSVQTYLAKASGPDIHDFGCTLKAYRASALDAIDLYGEGHRYIPAKLHRWGYDIDELEVSHRERFGGETKYGAARLVKGSLDLLFHTFWNRYSMRPLHFLGGSGAVVAGAGTIVGVHAVLSKYLLGVELLQHLPRLILTVALVLFGVQLIMFGFLAEMFVKLYYRDRTPYQIERVVRGEES